MSGWVIGPALSLAQLQATLARLGTAPGPATVRLYATPLPDAAEPLALPTDALATIPLASPPGSIVAGVLKLVQAEGGAMVQAAGIPRWGLLVAGDGEPLARGDVSDADHDGAIRIAGGATAPGDTSPALYAGGLVALAETFLT